MLSGAIGGLISLIVILVAVYANRRMVQIAAKDRSGTNDRTASYDR